MFIHGSAAAYASDLINVQKRRTFDDGVSDSDFDTSVHAAKGIYGVSVEVGGGGSTTGKAPVPGID